MSETTEETVIAFTVNLAITEQRIKDLLCSAFEGGSNYWILRVDEKPKSQRHSKSEYWHDGPVYGDNIGVYTIEEDGKRWELTKESLQKGMQIMAEKFPHHLADFWRENDDAITSDVFLQCCLFSDTMYG